VRETVPRRRAGVSAATVPLSPAREHDKDSVSAAGESDSYQRAMGNISDRIHPSHGPTSDRAHAHWQQPGAAAGRLYIVEK
jgi:hypothetical protein